MDYIGKSSISVPVLVVGKIAFLACSGFFLVKTFAVDTMLFDSVFTQVMGVVLYVAGFSMLTVALLQLGKSTAVGLPARETELKTHGIYRLTRNPIYLGAFIICAGSCVYSIHLVNFLLFAIAMAVHIQIIAKVEEFLEKRFGQRWLEYNSKYHDI